MVMHDNSTYNNKSALQLCQAFRSLFKGREDAWGGIEGLYNPEPVTIQHYKSHLEGKKSLGIYFVLDNHTCHFAAIDIDDFSFNKAVAVRDALKSIGIPAYIAASKSNHFHVYLFAKDRFIAKDIKRILNHTLKELGIKTDKGRDFEVFPKQDKHQSDDPPSKDYPNGQKHPGSYLNLPCCGVTRPFLAVDGNGAPKEIPLGVALERIQRTPNEVIAKILEGLPKETPEKPLKPRKKGKHFSHPACISKIFDGVEEGCRDEAAFLIARYWLTGGFGADTILPILQKWDKNNKPPINDNRILHQKISQAEKGYPSGCKSVQENGVLSQFCPGEDKCDWLKGGTTEKGKRTNQTERIVELAHSQDIYLFKDQYYEPCARINTLNHLENWRLNSKDFKLYLGGLLYQNKGETPNADSIRNAIMTLGGEALYNNPSNAHALNNRVALLNDAIYYDLSDPTWRAVKITSSGWEIINKPPILFRRYKHQVAQTEPTRDGDPWLLFDIVRVPKEQRLLLLTWAISCLIPDIPHTIPIPTGPEGSAKSWLCYVLRNIIDPSLFKHLSLRDDEREVVQTLDHNWCALFDNVSYLNEWQIDYLCRAVTGDGFSKRELYSDDEDVILTFKRCVGLNAIDLAVNRPDFLDRVILFPLDTIPDAERRAEGNDLEPKFTELKPKIFGGFLDTLSKAMAIKPTIKLLEKPRMADFTEWGCAISEALGYPKEAFLTSYTANIKARHSEILAGSTIGVLIMSFMANKDEWQGTATELLNLLTVEAGNMNINVVTKSFPKAANVLSGHLSRLKVNLAENGIIFEKVTSIGKAKQREIKLTKGEKFNLGEQEANGDDGETMG